MMHAAVAMSYAAMEMMPIPRETSHLASGVLRAGIAVMQIAAYVMLPRTEMSPAASGMSRFVV